MLDNPRIIASLFNTSEGFLGKQRIEGCIPVNQTRIDMDRFAVDDPGRHAPAQNSVLPGVPQTNQNLRQRGREQ